MSQYILIYFPNTLSEVSRNQICTSNNSAGITKSASAWLWPPCRCLQGYSPFPQHLTSLWLYFYSTSVSCQLQTTGLLCNQHDFQSHLTTHTHFPPNTSELRTWHRVMAQMGVTLGDKEQRVRSKRNWVSKKKGNTHQRPTQRMKSLCKKASCKQPTTAQPSPKIKTRQAWTFYRLLFGLTLKNSDSNSHLQGQGSLQIFVDTCCKYLRYNNHYHSEVRHLDTGWPSLSSHPKCSGIY